MANGQENCILYDFRILKTFVFLNSGYERFRVCTARITEMARSYMPSLTKKVTCDR